MHPLRRLQARPRRCGDDPRGVRGRLLPLPGVLRHRAGDDEGGADSLPGGAVIVAALPTPRPYECERCGWSGTVTKRPRCLRCAAEYTKQWRQKNPERAKEQKRRNYRNYKRQSPEYRNARKRRQKERNPETGKAAWRRRADWRRADWLLDGDVTAKDLVEIFERDGGHCVYCGDEVKPRFRAHDPRGFDHVIPNHVIPRVEGGKHTKENLVVSCGPCNAAKSGEVVND